ncbi:ATP-binding protein [Streptomyces flavofungini]|uniref:ATP-binding protein n=1 Tax=Streptomyces flavofungini TaxID=68200 RepID=UPI0025B0E39A|nr:ATP-binding protein [Streptomyces flavofungini]WJV48884.1 ATP-binding protein [Streptomyces flavofungini]
MAVMARTGTHYQQQLTADPVQIGRVRRISAALLRYWGWGEVAHPALLCVTELLANVARHTCSGDCELLLESSSASVRIVVSDDCKGMPVVREIDLDAEDGRGMLLIASTADAWGAAPTASGKNVWVIFYPRSPREGADG